MERTGHNEPVVNKQDDLELVKKDLETKLENMIAFAKHIPWGNWANIFSNIKDMISHREPALPEFHKDLIVFSNYSLLARQILSAAVESWCFTGMGSWSDNYAFKDDDEKEEITRELFLSVCNAYVAVVNSY
jgi:hypothetical protein